MEVKEKAFVGDERFWFESAGLELRESIPLDNNPTERAENTHSSTDDRFIDVKFPLSVLALPVVEEYH